MSQPEDSGVPDWSGLDGYPPPSESEDVCLWAWEFLRRWHEYRNFWKEKIEPFIGANGRIDRDANGNYWPYHDELKTRFGVDLPSPPHSRRLSHFVERYTTWVANDGRETQQICLGEHQIAIFFDLSRPLAPQFERAQASATREQEFRGNDVKNARIRADLYVPYLDSRCEGCRREAERHRGGAIS
jgi:hypothetical protein